MKEKLLKVYLKAKNTINNSRGDGAFNVVIGIILAVALGAIVFAALNLLFSTTIVKGLTDKVTEIFTKSPTGT